MRPGLPEKATHDYVRHGTTTLFAALEVATGKVTDACLPRHRHEEFLRFLKQVARAYPRRRAAPRRATTTPPTSTPRCKAWLAQNPRITMHFTPTSGSWLNLVEICFGIIRNCSSRTSAALTSGRCARGRSGIPAGAALCLDAARAECQAQIYRRS